MINTLRKKFILITIISIFVVFAIIVGIINVVNFARVSNDADNIAEYLAGNGGQFKKNSPIDDGINPLDGGGMIPPDQGFNINDEDMKNYNLDMETPYATRFFSVSLNPDGTYLFDLSQIAAVSPDEALTMTREVLSKHSTSGYIDGYRYNVVNDGHMVIFINCASQLRSANNMLWISILVAFVALGVISILVIIISKKVVKPIADSYTKQKQFITDASHELKTPLTIISANNEISEIEFGESEASKQISKQVNRMTQMVKNLTALARMDENKDLEKADLNLSDIMDDMIESFRPAITTNERKLNTNIEEGVKYYGDEKLIKQLISIVLENASKYTKTTCSVKLSRNGNKIEILAQNDASGINAENMDVCFERFYRTDKSRGSGVEGSGIGLSIAKEIVDRHKGTITAYGDKDSFFNIKIVL